MNVNLTPDSKAYQTECARTGVSHHGNQSLKDWTDKQGHHHEDTYEGGRLTHQSELWQDPKGHWNRNYVSHGADGRNQSSSLRWSPQGYQRTDRGTDRLGDAWTVNTSAKGQQSYAYERLQAQTKWQDPGAGTGRFDTGTSWEAPPIRG